MMESQGTQHHSPPCPLPLTLAIDVLIESTNRLLENPNLSSTTRRYLDNRLKELEAAKASVRSPTTIRH